jgi:hypothetical protein
MATRPNNFFALGETYRDRKGAYTVISIEENRLVYDYGDGINHKGAAEIKWRIHCNILSEKSSRHNPNPSQQLHSANDEEFWTYEEVSPIFADIIKAHGKTHKDFMTREEIVAAFVDNPEGQLILNRPHDERSNLYWAGVMKAHFSRKYNSGRSEWDDCFEPMKIGQQYAYRVRKKA